MKGAGGSSSAASAAALPSHSLSSLFSSLCAPETLEGETAYQCEACATSTTAVRSTALHKLPRAMVLHVNRARWAPRRGLLKREKLHDHVAFPLTLTAGDLAGVLTPEAHAAYVGSGEEEEGIHGATGSGAGAQSGGAAAGTTTQSSSRNATSREGSASSSLSSAALSSAPVAGVPPVRAPTLTSSGVAFRLVAVVVHKGRGIESGHYYTLAREDPHDGPAVAAVGAAAAVAHAGQPAAGPIATEGEGTWLLFDDNAVKPVSLDTVLASQAYLLCYERV